MSSILAMGGLVGWVILNLILMGYTAAYEVEAQSECREGVKEHDWVCGSPFEALAVANAQKTNVFVKVARVMQGVLSLVMGFILLDYDILRGEGIIDGGIGLIFRMIGWVAAAMVPIGVGLRLFGRG